LKLQNNAEVYCKQMSTQTGCLDPNAGQASRWNGIAGRGWVEVQDLTDSLYKPMEDLLLAGITTTGPMLDVGCGTGSTSLAIKPQSGELLYTGIDISEPMIRAARNRPAPSGVSTRFICGDAQTYEFEPSSFSTIISRFGVMFFADPVRAFANLRRAAKDDAQLRFVAWRGTEENPFIAEAERAGAAHLPALPPRQNNEPGPVAFADPGRVHMILEQSHWTEIEILPVDVECSMPDRDLKRYLTNFGPVAAALQEPEPERAEQILQEILPAFSRYRVGSEVRFSSACWMVNARAGASPQII
jgi:ubiquinone/menaquinone biosynthesis C-methylase UbiE